MSLYFQNRINIVNGFETKAEKAEEKKWSEIAQEIEKLEAKWSPVYRKKNQETPDINPIAAPTAFMYNTFEFKDFEADPMNELHNPQSMICLR